MKANLAKLVDGCLDAHINSATSKDAAKQFRALIAHAYDLGVRDEKEEQQKIKDQLEEDRKKSAAIEEGRNEKETCLFKEESSQETNSQSQGQQSQVKAQSQSKENSSRSVSASR